MVIAGEFWIYLFYFQYIITTITIGNDDNKDQTEYILGTSRLKFFESLFVPS